MICSKQLVIKGFLPKRMHVIKLKSVFIFLFCVCHFPFVPKEHELISWFLHIFSWGANKFLSICVCTMLMTKAINFKRHQRTMGDMEMHLQDKI